MSSDSPMKAEIRQGGGDQVPHRHSLAIRAIRRIGCWLIVACWFLLLLTPCALFYLAANGEIRFHQPDAPQPHAHPRLLITLINDPDNRGLQFLRSYRVGGASDNDVCMQTAVNYLLWAGAGGNQDVIYCECYARADNVSSWSLLATHISACP